jgi:hypothetical protein
MALFDDLTEENQEKAMEMGYFGFFSERDSVQEAYNYALSIAEACGDDKPWVITAIQVLVNTYAVQIAKDEDIKVALG